MLGTMHTLTKTELTFIGRLLQDIAHLHSVQSGMRVTEHVVGEVLTAELTVPAVHPEDAKAVELAIVLLGIPAQGEPLARLETQFGMRAACEARGGEVAAAFEAWSAAMRASKAGL